MFIVPQQMCVFCVGSLFCYVIISVISQLAIILLRKKVLTALVESS